MRAELAMRARLEETVDFDTNELGWLPGCSSNRTDRADVNPGMSLGDQPGRSNAIAGC